MTTTAHRAPAPGDGGRYLRARGGEGGALMATRAVLSAPLAG